MSIDLVKRSCQLLMAALAHDKSIDSQSKSMIEQRVFSIFQEACTAKSNAKSTKKMEAVFNLQIVRALPQQKAARVIACKILEIATEGATDQHSAAKALLERVVSNTALRFSGAKDETPSGGKYAKTGVRKRLPFKELSDGIPTQKNLVRAFVDELADRYQMRFGKIFTPSNGIAFIQDLFDQILGQETEAMKQLPLEFALNRISNQLARRIEGENERTFTKKEFLAWHADLSSTDRSDSAIAALLKSAKEGSWPDGETKSIPLYILSEHRARFDSLLQELFDDPHFQGALAAYLRPFKLMN